MDLASPIQLMMMIPEAQVEEEEVAAVTLVTLVMPELHG